ncbi:MAG: ABC transporter [Maritimibacter sp.]|nr:ABC transporter [Maritimibacter sp.]
MTTLLRLENLSRDFFGIPATQDVTLDIPKGVVLGLVGENGAGKSTLMNMIGGVLPPSSGRMLWKGADYAPRDAVDATEAGIAFIHQELNLFHNLTIAENLFVDGFPKRFGLIDRRAIDARAAELLALLELDAAPNALIEELSPGERQLVEIAKALHREAELIIFDEPTTSLTPRETRRLFDVIARLKSSGKTVVFISHVLGDVAAHCDRLAVLRDGRLVDEGATADFPIPKMIRAMIGRELSGLFPDRTGTPRREVVLSARGLSQPGVIENVGLEVRAGEILGLFGLMGSGRSELARILFGLDPHERGEVSLSGSVLDGGPRHRIARGMAFVTENRREEGLMMEMPVADNLSLVTIDDFGRMPVAAVDRAALRDATENMRDKVQLKASDIAVQPAKSLSGGNQQKVVIGKWLMADPRFFILDEPTRGVDVGAKYEIYALADRLAADGGAVLLISSEIEELMGLCDRIVVMNRGEIVGEFTERPFSDEAILAAAFREAVA